MQRNKKSREQPADPRRAALAVVAWLTAAAAAMAQPTYKLDVKPHLRPWATLRLDGLRLMRSAVEDDPGFRLQYHFRKDGKTIATLEARASRAIAVPRSEPGVYTVVLELFFPAYKGGTEQKGVFKPVSNILTYRMEAGSPAKATLVESRVLVVACGKANGKEQEVLVGKGYGYKLVQGTAVDDWPKTAGKTHRWQDAKQLRLELQLPPGTAGTLRLHLVEGDGVARREKVTIRGRSVGEFTGFGTTGRAVEIAVTMADSKDGKVEVALENLLPSGTAVVSAIEFLPQPAASK
jgi:hypothetical protein